MTKKKIILLSLIALFAIILTFQITINSQKTTKKIVIEDTITSIIIREKENQIILTLENDEWYVNGEKANHSLISEMTYALKNITLLQKVSNGKDLERYDLVESPIVTVKNQDNTLLTLNIGKTSQTTSQTYVQVNHESAIYLSSQGLNDLFTLSYEDLLAPPEEEATTSEEANTSK